MEGMGLRAAAGQRQMEFALLLHKAARGGGASLQRGFVQEKGEASWKEQL